MFSAEKTTQTLIEFDKQYPNKTSQIVEIFIDSLKNNKEMYQLSSIIQLLERKAQRQRKQDKLHITLFESVSQGVIEKIKKLIGVSNKSDAEIEIDEQIKGGFIAHYQGVIFDASVKNQFVKLKNVLKE